MSKEQNSEDQGSRLMKAVEAVAIKPEDAKALVDQYKNQARKKNPKAGEEEIREIVAKKAISRYSKLSATSGGSTALTGIVPGIGTAIAMVGGGLTDATISMKFQVDMTMCIAETYGWDLSSEDAKHLTFLIAAGSSLEKLGKETGTKIATKAGVKMLNTYLKGASLAAIKEMFKRIGITFTRKAVEKAIPFGVGVVIGSSLNYALTRYVGNTALEWFKLDQEINASMDIIE